MSSEVEMGCWGRYTPGEDLNITGLGPCVGVIIYEADSKIAFACHLTWPHAGESDVLADMLTHAAAEFVDSHRVQIYAAGACDSRSRPLKDTTKKRDHVVNALRDAFPDRVPALHWPGPEFDSVNMTLDTETGAVYFELGSLSS